MAKLLIACLACLCLMVKGNAQNINEYRYWWDGDISTLTTEPVSPEEVFTLETTLPAASLSNGIHTISIQFKDDNDEWSVPYSFPFSVLGKLVQYEYWFDDDIGTRVIEATDAVDTQDIQTSFDATMLSAGVHKISIRSLDSNGEASSPYTSHFKVSGGELVSWEYWFDDAIGLRIQEDIAPPVNTLDLVESLDVTALEQGSHTVTWRTVGANGSWSVPITYEFDIVVGIDEASGLNSVVIFPSPTRDQLNIRVESNTALMWSMEILNDQGQLILSRENVNTSLLSTDVTDLASGTYLIRLGYEDNFTIHRFIKQ